MSKIEYERRELEMKSLKKKRRWRDGLDCPFCDGEVKVCSTAEFYGTPYSYKKWWCFALPVELTQTSDLTTTKAG